MEKVRFVDTDRGVRAVDDIEDRAFQFHLPDGSAVESIRADRFTFPVTAAVEVEASRVLVPEFFGLFVYDRDEGGFVRAVEPATEASIPPGAYDVDLSNAPLKIYVSFEGALEVSRSPEGTVLEFDGSQSIAIGARSLHSRPAGTVTATESVEDLMYAVSSFGSAMKTFSPERSFPTLRGHPPRLEIGEERATPPGIEPPDTGVEIAVPPDVRSVYTVASLSYYLGARIVPGDDPAIVAGGDRFPLVGDAAPRGADSLIDGAAAALERQFALDCAVRTAGIYDAQLREAERLKRNADVDLDRLYGLPLADRIAAYFRIPGRAADDLLGWHSTADVLPSLQYATYLPYVVAELSHVRSYDPAEADAELVASPTGMDDFFRATGSDSAPSAGVGTRSTPGASVRSTDVSGRNPREIDEVVTPPDVDTDVHVWLADRYPLRAGKPTLESLERRFDADVAGDDSERIRVLVVCNEPEMREESEDLYGFRDYFEFDIDVRQDLSTEELRNTLREDFDFFHYVGHVDERGMRCDDGWLDLRNLDDTGVELFFLNACTSFRQGRALVDAGSRGGVITLSEVYNSLATRFGRRLARLLDAGFDLYGALAAGRDSVIGGGMYGIVGDGRASLCHNTDGVPTLYHVDRVDHADRADRADHADRADRADHADRTDHVDHADRADSGQFEIVPVSYPTLTYGIGSMSSFVYETDELMHVVSGSGDPYRLSTGELAEFLTGKAIPIEVDGVLYWSNELEPSDV